MRAEIKSLTKSLEEKEKQLQQCIKENLNFQSSLKKTEENLIQQFERNKYIDKELNSYKDKANSYKSKYEELSVENGHLRETLTYKDDKIKRDAERLKSLKDIEKEFNQIKFLNKDLEETLRIYQSKFERLTETIHSEKDKWYKKEKCYHDTIDNLVKEMNGKDGLEEEKNILSNAELLNIRAREVENEEEIKKLKAEIDSFLINKENCEKKIHLLSSIIKGIDILIIQIEEILRCTNCKSSEKSLMIISGCAHLICKECNGTNCKECYSSSLITIQPSFLECIPGILVEMKRKISSL